MMFGYACDPETPELMPLAISLAHKLARKLADVRKSGSFFISVPTAKPKVTVEYVDGVPSRIDTVVISTKHDPRVSLEQIRRDVIDYIVRPVIPANGWMKIRSIFVNPTGRFEIGGPVRILV